MEARRVIERETACANALSGLEQVARGVEQFDCEWDELVKASLPSCWEPETSAFIGLTDYEQKLNFAFIMNQNDLPLEKTTRLNVETIIAALSKEFSLFCQVKKYLTVQVDYTELADIEALVDTFITMLSRGESI